MFSLSPMKDLYESPLPPMALTDYAAFSKFLNQALHRCHEAGRDFNVFLDWAIRALSASLAADSGSRIFLPKTRTAPFALDDLIPLSGLPASGQRTVDLGQSYVVAPVWNNTDLMEAVEAFADSGFEDAKIEQPFHGAYIEELKLAIIDSPSDVDVPYILSLWQRGSVPMGSYSLRKLAPVLSTDGAKWFLRDKQEAELEFPVVEPRMAILYNCGLRRYCEKG